MYQMLPPQRGHMQKKGIHKEISNRDQYGTNPYIKDKRKWNNKAKPYSQCKDMFSTSTPHETIRGTVDHSKHNDTIRPSHDSVPVQLTYRINITEYMEEYTSFARN